MERFIKIGGLEIKTKMLDEKCRACAAVGGEMSVLVTALEERTLLVDQDLEAEVQCHASSGRKITTRHIDIVLNVGEEEIHAERVVRNWGRRRVHCGIK